VVTSGFFLKVRASIEVFPEALASTANPNAIAKDNSTAAIFVPLRIPFLFIIYPSLAFQ
jgi:hypothetical protein